MLKFHTDNAMTDLQADCGFKSAVALGSPPLPLLEDFAAIGTFLQHSIDDLVEDLVKLCLWLALASVCTAVIRRRVHSNTGTRISMAGAALIAFPYIDAIGDAAGDLIQPWQDTARKMFGGADIRCRSSSPNALSLSIDDVVEDTFKGVCMYAHYRVGLLLASATVPHALHQSNSISVRSIGRASAAAVTLAHPAAAYTACNEYADALGDRAQHALFGRALD